MKRRVWTGLIILGVVAGLLFLMVYRLTVGIEAPGSGKERVAIIRIEGVILDAKDTLSEIERYRNDPTVKGIVLRVDSPGGAVVPAQEIYEEIKKAREKGSKKVVASMGNVAASGGYYIAVAADRIVANPGTLTGSIGVIMELANVEKLFRKLGVESVVIKAGQHKDLGSPFRAMDEEERRLLQGVLDDVHGQFIQAVSEGRGLDAEKVRRWADGRVFTGRQAKEIGLVDELGNLQDAIDLLANLAGISGKPIVVESKKRFSWFDLLTSQLGDLRPAVMRVPSISLQYLMSAG